MQIGLGVADPVAEHEIGYFQHGHNRGVRTG
jgi:hypothetical protein